MSYLFIRAARGFRRVELDPAASPIDLRVLTASPARSTLTAPAGVWLSLTQTRNGPRWLLHVDCNRPIRVNNELVDTGIRILRDRDSISWSAAPAAYFSAEARPTIVRFPETAGDIDCARCRLPIDPGRNATQCPDCDAWFHQDPDIELGCWLDAPDCTRCEAPTAYDAPLRWTPE